MSPDPNQPLRLFLADLCAVMRDAKTNSATLSVGIKGLNEVCFDITLRNPESGARQAPPAPDRATSN